MTHDVNSACMSSPQAAKILRITCVGVAKLVRLKPRIPSLPQFSFCWDYRYEHLNVDIHGLEPAVIDWWTMGGNGYGPSPQETERAGLPL